MLSFVCFLGFVLATSNQGDQDLALRRLEEGVDECNNGGCEAMTGTSNVSCNGGNCKMPQCTESCSCNGGNCEMEACTKDCSCNGGNCAKMGPCAENCTCEGGDCNMDQTTANASCDGGGCSMAACTGTCDCLGGNCAMALCTSKCLCGGGCDMATCASGCACYTKLCANSATSVKSSQLCTMTKCDEAQGTCTDDGDYYSGCWGHLGVGCKDITESSPNGKPNSSGCTFTIEDGGASHLSVAVLLLLFVW